jgi:O-antigen/teichoic acid export membrane protein
VSPGAAARDDLFVAAKGGGVVFLGRMFAWGSRFVIAIFLARLLGAEEYGLLSLALATVTIVSSFAILGLDAALVRFTAIFAGRGDRSSLLGTLQLGIGAPAAVGLVLGAGVLVLADPIAILVFDEPALAPVLRVSAILVPVLVTNAVLAATLQGLRHIQYAVVAEQFSQQILRFGFLLAFLLVGLTAFWSMLASALAGIGVTLILAYFTLRVLPKGLSGTTPNREPRMILSFSIPVWMSNVVTTLGHTVQITLLGALSTSSAVGIFAIAGNVTMLGTMFHTAVVTSSMPLFARLQDVKDRVAIEHLYRTTSKWTLAANLPLFLFLVLFPSQTLAVFGSEFREGSVALSIMAWGGLVNAATGTSGVLLDMSGHTRLKLLNSTVAVGSGIGLSVVLIPPFGLVGAAVASAAPLIIVNLMRLVEVAVLIRVTPYDRSYVKPLVASALAAAAAVAVTIAIAIDPVLEAAVGFAVIASVYVAATARLGLTADDRAILHRAWRRFRRTPAGRSKADPAAPADPTDPTAEGSGR